MRAWLGPYGLALAALWLAGIVAARIYPWPVPVPPAVTAAFLVEGSLFLMLGFPAVLERLKGWPPVVVAISAVVPYCLYAAPGGLFNPVALAALFALASLAVLWFRILPRNRWMDLAFLIFVAAVSLARVFPELYAPVAPRLKVDFLGQLMWRRVAILSVLLYRPVEGVDLGWGPRRREWLAGLGEFAWCAPLGAALSLAIGFVRFQPRSGEAWELALAAAGIFLGMLWFVALTEEFFFRGLLQQWLSEWFASSRWGLIAASLVFGAAHLTFRYPPLNWRFALVAALAGFFYGRAFQRGGIRAAMVTHALVNVTWRMVFV